MEEVEMPGKSIAAGAKNSAICAKDVEADRQAIREYLNRWARVRSRDGDTGGAAPLMTAGIMIVLGSHTDQEIQSTLVDMAGAA